MQTVQKTTFLPLLVPCYTKIKADIYLIATQWDNDKKIMENVFEAIRGCTRDCFEECSEKGVIYGAGLDNVKEVLNNGDLMLQAYTMGKNV